MRSLPLAQKAADRRAFDGHQALDGLANGVAPAGAAVFTLGEDVDPHVALEVQRLEDRVVLDLSELVGGDPVVAEVVARL